MIPFRKLTAGKDFPLTPGDGISPNGNTRSQEDSEQWFDFIKISFENITVIHRANQMDIRFSKAENFFSWITDWQKWSSLLLIILRN